VMRAQSLESRSVSIMRIFPYSILTLGRYQSGPNFVRIF
jgi:hypothetical protein